MYTHIFIFKYFKDSSHAGVENVRIDYEHYCRLIWYKIVKDILNNSKILCHFKEEADKLKKKKSLSEL